MTSQFSLSLPVNTNTLSPFKILDGIKELGAKEIIFKVFDLVLELQDQKF